MGKLAPTATSGSAAVLTTTFGIEARRRRGWFSSAAVVDVA
ncbi:hypothetical protein [Streptomyces sp. ME18-1-4]|nr:hypothetical protein [Streptomyces sp. ME18-1-4]MDX3248518.1 hypothetical protein [Streptomyces sp. ME18-1-4]